MSDRERQDLLAFSMAVRELREQRSMSSRQLAQAAGIEHGCLEAVGAGELDPPFDLMVALGRALGVVWPKLVVAATDHDVDAACVLFGRQLRALRNGQQLSQARLAHRTGIHPTAIRRLERGDREPRLTTIQRLAHGLRVPAGALLDDPNGEDAQSR
jgi:transcriptional regulator with XRE-family HTH domain